MASVNSRRLAWGLGILVLAGALAWFFVDYFRTEKRTPSWARGRVSEFLLELDLGGGPKGLDSIQVPEGFEVELAAGPDLVNYGVFFTFDDRGRLFVCESAGKNTTNEETFNVPSFRIRLLEDTNGDGIFDQSKIFADTITMALGAQWYRGSLYVAAPPDFIRFDDTDGDGVADNREVILTGWPLKSNATTLHGPYLGPDGWMYLTYSPQVYKVETKEGTVLEGRGRVFRVKPDGTRLEWFVGGGFDNPVEVVFTAAGETLGTNTYFSNPKNGIRDSILHYIDGGIYPKWRPYVETAYQRTGDFLSAVTKFARVAPAGLALYRGTAFGPEYRGNLFSAQFNPHRVQRHILHRDGGTFRTKDDDEDFMTSTDSDLHVTDVQEDADGSLLVLDTGAWYLHSCPVSRVSKPEYTGAIFRIRKIDAPRIEDPRGEKIEWEKTSPADLAKLLEDSRIVVRDKALDLLVQAAGEAVEALNTVRQSSESPEVRASAVFGLGRIFADNQTETASASAVTSAGAAVREALSDPDLIVRVAAARMAGLNEDREAVERLMEMVRRDEGAARRQAAEALGRIGDNGSVPALIEASANPEDRFVEHAVIYALIRLRATGPLIEALKDRRPRVRKAALIALDQMEGSPLRREHLVSQLDATDERLGDAVLWVAGHHPDWSGDVLAFLGKRLRNGPTLTEEQDPVRRALLAFCGDAGMQRMTAELLADAALGSDRKLYILDTVNECSLDNLPAAWIAEFRGLLAGPDNDDALRQRVVSFVGARRIADLDAELEKIAGTPGEPDELRVSALAALVAHRPGLTEPDFLFVLSLLGDKEGADLRLSAARVLRQARLSEGQLAAVARGVLPEADPLILPVLLDAFEYSGKEDVGKALVEGLSKSPDPLSVMSSERLRDVVENYPRSVRALAEPLLAQADREKENRAERLQELVPLLTAGGDAGRGRNVFFGKKAACSSCHTIGAEGGHVGPDLTAVGSVRAGIDILEAVVFPSASFVREHEVYRVKTASEIYSGVRGPSTADVVVIISGPGDRVRIPRSQVVSMELSTVSLMPDGFDKNLTRQEMIDLLAFLQAQKSRRLAEADI